MIEQHYLDHRRGSKTPILGRDEKMKVCTDILRYFGQEGSRELNRFVPSRMLTQNNATDDLNKSRNSQMKYSTYSKQADIVKSNRELVGIQKKTP